MQFIHKEQLWIFVGYLSDIYKPQSIHLWLTMYPFNNIIIISSLPVNGYIYPLEIQHNLVLTLLALEKVLIPESNSNTLKEDEPAFGEKEQYNSQTVLPSNKKPGEYTLDDYYALPDDQRVELIDGVFYDMSAPSTIHQIISLNMSIQIKRFIDKNKGNCMVFIAPCDVQLDMDNKTMVQPDVMIICKKDKIVKKNIFGCPDFIVEVLSSSTKKKDMSLKLAKYENAGVKEYWMVDPDKLKIIVYDFAHDYDVSIYGFEDKVPVGLYDAVHISFSIVYVLNSFP